MNSFFILSFCTIIFLSAQKECSHDSSSGKSKQSSAQQSENTGINQPPIVIVYDSANMPDPAMIRVDTSFFLAQIDSLNVLIGANPEDASLYARRGDIKSSLGDYDGACADYQKAKKFGSKDFKSNIEKYCK